MVSEDAEERVRPFLAGGDPTLVPKVPSPTSAIIPSLVQRLRRAGPSGEPSSTGGFSEAEEAAERGEELVGSETRRVPARAEGELVDMVLFCRIDVCLMRNYLRADCEPK